MPATGNQGFDTLTEHLQGSDAGQDDRTEPERSLPGARGQIIPRHPEPPRDPHLAVFCITHSPEAWSVLYDLRGSVEVPPAKARVPTAMRAAAVPPARPFSGPRLGTGWFAGLHVRIRNLESVSVKPSLPV